jgi:OOP family OmpA-OmpF porin
MQIKKLVALTAMAFAASTAFAGDLYVLGSVGQSNANDLKGSIDGHLRSLGATSVSSTADDSDSAFKLQIGTRVNKNFAIEGGYFNLGKFNYSATTVPVGTANASYKADGWNITAVGILPVGEQFSVFAKLGGIYTQTKSSLTCSGAVTCTSGKDNKGGVVYGLGASYNLTKQTSIRAEYEVYDKVGADNIGTTKVDVWSVGVAYKF